MSSAVPETVLSVGDFTRRVKALLEGNMASCWVRGEVSNLRRQNSGHVYFTLKDKDSQLSCVLFRGNAMRQTVELRDGRGIIVFGEVSVYEPRGTHQLICRQLMEDGAGRLQEAFERLKRKLEAEGLFAKERKRPLPKFPQRVAFITSASGAAWQDFRRILERRQWRGHLQLVPAVVQGRDGEASLVSGLERVAAWNRSHPQEAVEVVVIGRGGGSLEDLWCFNEEAVTRAVAACPVPVISAVGHEIDFTLCDFAADVRAETPSGAAEIISSSFLEVLERRRDAARALRQQTRQHLQTRQQQWERGREALASVHPSRRLEAWAQHLDELARRCKTDTQEQLQGKREQVSVLATRLARHAPAVRLQWAQQRHRELAGRLPKAVRQALRQHDEHLRQWAARLSQAGLPATLRRGFALVRDAETDEPLASAAELGQGRTLQLQFHDGRIRARSE